jgi:uncharacterized membrane protein YfhO
MNNFNKMGQYKLVIFLRSLYIRFITICSIPFEKIENLTFSKKIFNNYKNNPKKDYVILIGVIILISVILFHKFIFGNYVLIFNQHDVSKDCIEGLYPYIYNIFKNKEGLSLWSFNSGLGNNMFPLIVSFFIDPFALIGAFFWNPIENGFIYIYILKLICIAIVFYKFILVITQNRYSALLTSIIISFNGFLMLWGQHYYFVNKILYFIILIYSLEIFLRTDKKLLLLFALVLNLTDVYFFYQNVFFIGFYLIFRNLYYKEDFRVFLIKLGEIVIIGVVALLLSSVLILPYIYVLGNGPRISTEKIELGKMIFSIQSFDYYLTLIGRLFSNNLSGNGLNYFGYFNNYMVAPQIYSGLLTILLLPQIFVIQDKQIKKALLFLFILSIVTLVFPFFAYLFTAFQELYYRWTYGIIVLNLISLAYLLKLILKEKLLNVKLLNFTFFILIGLLLLFWMYYRRHDGEWSFNEIRGAFYADKNGHIKIIILRSIFYLTLYLILIQLLNRFKVVIAVVLLLTISSELIIENYSTFYDRGIVKKNQNPYMNTSAKIINFIKSQDKTDFYRIEKEYYAYGSTLEYNDALVHDYYGLKTYNTYNNKGYFEFCKTMNLVEKNHWANILPSWKADMDKRRKLLSLFSVKYLLTKNEIKDSTFKLINKKEDIYIYKNLNVLPFGFTYSKIIERHDFDKLSKIEKDNIILNQLVVEDLDKGIFIGNNLKDKSLELNRDDFNIKSFKNSEIKGEINSKENSVLFFSIPYDEGWKIKVNNKVVDYYKVNIGFIGLPLSKGVNNIELTYLPPFLKIGAIISLSTLLLIIIYFIFMKMRKVKVN